MSQVLITPRSFDNGGAEPLEILTNAGLEPVRENSPSFNRDSVIAYIAGLEPIGGERMDLFPNLKVISRFGVGTDSVDIAEASKRGIIVTNTPGTNNNSVADLAFALILSAARMLPPSVSSSKAEKFARFPGTEVWGKTLGIAGLGSIGKGVALRAKGFNMEILAHDPFLDEKFAGENNIKPVTMDELLKLSDFISLHLPLTNETRNIVDLSLVKPSAILVNTARGGLVDEKALYEALKNNKLAAAALDVTENEPPAGSPLLSLDNCFITSHIGGYTKEAAYNMGILASENIVEVLQNGFCKFIVKQ